jgi:RHS repeat-associated protein
MSGIKSARHVVAALIAVFVFQLAAVIQPVPAKASARPPSEKLQAKQDAPGTSVVGYGATGWKALPVAFNGNAGFEASGFDDSSWPTGQAAFGSGGGCPLQATVHTSWPTNTDLLVRRHLSQAELAPGQGVQIWFAIDNDIMDVYWNGTRIGGGITHENCATIDSFGISVPPASITTDNVLAVRARDRGVESFLDLAVVKGGMGSEGAPFPMVLHLNGGTSPDPVQTFHGAFMYRHPDLSIPGRGPAISFLRSYNSGDTRVGPMGPGWTHTYNARIRDTGDGTGDLYLVRPNGNTDRFKRNNDETFSPSLAVYSTLIRNADESYTVTEKDLSRWDFDGAGRLTTITDRYGNASTLTYNGSGQLATIADPAGRGSLTLTYTNGLLTAATDWASPARTVTYQYDGSGRLWKVTDRESQTTTFTYDGTSARIATITDARNHVALTLTYDAQGRVATQKNAKGLVTGDATTFAYVVNGDGTRVTTFTEPVTSFEPSFHPTVEDTYDASGWLTKRISKPSSTETLTETYTYDSIGNRASVTDPRGNRTDYCYDVSYAGGAIGGSRGNLTRVIGPPPVAGANRPVTLLAYDGKNNVTQTVAPKGVPSTPTTTCASNLAAITTAYTTDLGYDASGVKLLSATSRFTDPDTGLKTGTTKYEYADAGNPGLVTKVIPARGNTTGSPDYTYATSMAYFATGSKAGLLSSVTDALANLTTFDYDSVGRLVSSVDPNGNAAGGVPADHATNYIYDKEDRTRFVKLPAPAAGGAQLVSETRYDEVGNPIVRIDPNGQVTTNSYDERDGLFQVKESPNSWTDPVSPPAGVITTEYAYDAVGNLTRMTRAKGDASNERVTDYAYDGRRLARRETQYPAWPTTTPTLVTTSTYDPAGNYLTLVDPLGQTTTRAYDALNRLTSIDYSSAATPDVGYGYDANGNRTTMTDGTGSATYLYDEANRLTSTTTPGPKTVGYRYDLDGNRTKLIYPDATAVAYAFNKAGQLASLQDWAGRSVSYTYRPDGLVKTATNADASVGLYGYDNAARLMDILQTTGATAITHDSYVLDPIGNVMGLSEYVQGITANTGNWSTASRVNDDTGTADQTRPALATGPGDSVAGAWTDNRLASTPDVYFSLRPATGAWGPNARVNDVTTRGQYDPDIATDSAGKTVAVWTDERAAANDPDIYASQRNPSTGVWATSVRVNDDGSGRVQQNSAIAISSAGDAVAVWVDRRGGGNQWHIYSSRQTAGSSTWLPNIRVTTDTAATKATPDVAYGPDGTAYVVWQDSRSGSGGRVWFASLAPGASGWTGETQIGDNTAQSRPKIGVDGTGNVMVVWQDARVFGGEIRARRRAAGSTNWDASVVVGYGPDAPGLAVVPGGSAFASWTDGGSPDHVSVAQFDPTTLTWSGPTFLEDANSKADDVALAVTSSSVTVAWSGGTIATDVDYDIRSRSRSLAAGTDQFTYGYDRLNRLTSVSGPGGNPTYGYDPIGNRTSKVLSGVTTTSTYDGADRIATSGALVLTVNANGNTTAKGGDTFTYDQPNRLKTATVSGTTETYVYDGDGTRFSRQVGAGSPIRYVSDVNRSLPVTIDDGSRKYVYGLGLAYAIAGSAVEVYHTDRLGSVRAISDAAGAVSASYRTDEWGIPTTTTGSSSQPLRFTGEPQDATSLTYLRARYYDAGLGRLMSRDILPGRLAIPQSLNRYSYALNNPLSLTDPSGRDPNDPLFCDLVNGCAPMSQWKTALGVYTTVGAGTIACALACVAALAAATEGWLALKDRIQAILQSAPRIDPSQLQSKFKHASDFGIEGPWNKETAAAYEQAIQRFVASFSGVSGTLRGQAGTWYLDADSRLAVFVDKAGNYVSGWKLSPDQLAHFPYIGGG